MPLLDDRHPIAAVVLARKPAPQTEIPGRLRVAPGDPDSSYLLEKIERATPTSGKRMPPEQPLDPRDIDTVRAWILQGAKDN
jgi:hypothetical protein